METGYHSVIGICRFSFLGRGDWVRYRAIVHGEENSEIYAAAAKELYSPERMNRRFFTFENITLPSILNQTEKDFIFLVISSKEMPKKYKDRLEQLCYRSLNIKLVFSETYNISDTISPILTGIGKEGKGVVQFRLDDDDAVSDRYVELVREHAFRMRDLNTFALTFRKGISSICYPGKKIIYAQDSLPFQSASSVIKFKNPHRNIFEVGHLAMQHKYTHIQDVNNFGAFMMKWPSDSREIDPKLLPKHMKEISYHEFKSICRDNFRNLERFNFDSFLGFFKPAGDPS